GALVTNTTGGGNAAFGSEALLSNTMGAYNTASGVNALYSNTTGGDNTASGYDALVKNSTGYYNTASGTSALYYNTTGAFNTASGTGALESNTTGYENTASGLIALYSNTTGAFNTASGTGALEANTTGNNNIGLGDLAGINIQTGSNNIEIGGAGTSDESNTIRIGSTQSATYIAGISAATVSGADVVVSSTGQLGVATSSARYKRDIRDMGDASAGLMKLRPVTFRYKSDPTETLQYGLVAEEVARVYPELVVRGTDGKLQSVRYLEFTALLLNQLQQQARDLQKQTNQLQMQGRNIMELGQQNRELRSEVAQVHAAQVRERTAFNEWLAALERSVWANEPAARLSAVTLRTESPSRAR
ncbi:MAG: tail fiber domain-containing protein, partial [Deltaproteobacteria bacterium]|nr:tail fiber domain-containing protein [Deltaproteobacteria bacterium]